MIRKGVADEDAFMTFSTPLEWEEWLSKNHALSPGVRIRFFNKSADRGGLGRKEALETALMYGWIDSVLNNYDKDSYLLRFTPRRKESHWSRVNLESAERLMAEGKMTEAGLRALGDLKARYESLRARMPPILTLMFYSMTTQRPRRRSIPCRPRIARATGGTFSQQNYRRPGKDVKNA